MSLRFTNRGVKQILSIKDLNQSSLSIKILEKHICKYFIDFHTNHNLLYKCQSGFRANHSCKTILIKIADEWLATMNKGLFTGVMIDLHKAFDVVDHKLLLKKLQVYGLTPSNGSKVTSAEGIKRYVLMVNYLNHSVFTMVYCKGV